MGKKRGRHASRSWENDRPRFRQETDRPQYQQQQQQERMERPRGTIRVEARTDGQRRYLGAVRTNTITICTGPAGCGKTAIAVGTALQNLLSGNPTFQKIIIMRPVKEACDESIGFLPGGLDEKMEPWAAPIVDNLGPFVDKSAIYKLFRDKVIEIVPLAYARGRSLNNSFVIVDEAQNCSKKQMIMILTRIGENSKMVINGDLAQNDGPKGGSGLEDAISRLDGMDGIGIVRLDDKDIVRHPMIGEILRRYSDGYVIGSPPLKAPAREFDCDCACGCREDCQCVGCHCCEEVDDPLDGNGVLTYGR